MPLCMECLSGLGKWAEKELIQQMAAEADFLVAGVAL